MKTEGYLPISFVLSLLLLLDVPPVCADDCAEPERLAGVSAAPTFTITLPVVPRYQWDPSMVADSLVVPDGRPIYALFVHGYSQNTGFNLLLCYEFAKRLMEDGAYVHYAWWNNLCAEYMARPLHQLGAYPGHRGLWGMSDGLFQPDRKALPVDDYQFQADAELFLQAIREHNPSAMIIVVGHSMGGAAVARLGTNTDVVIDILAPLDPVDNRSSPWVPLGTSPYHNWTRYRIAREDLDALPPPTPSRPRTFRRNVINLHHRYQMEAVFPMDCLYREHFAHDVPPGGTSTQRSVTTCDSAILCTGECCALDGHGEMVGYRGLTLLGESHAWALQAQADWPTGRSDADICRRRRLLMELPYADHLDDWVYRPSDPTLCLVSPGLIRLYETMNRPPVADAGGDRTVVQSPSGVTLDGSASADPDGDDLTYTWRGAQWETVGRIGTVVLEPGTHDVTLTVRDPCGHIDRDAFELTVEDGSGVELPLATRIVGARPNPFQDVTRVVFELAEQQRVSLQIFDLQGHLVRTLAEGTFDPGRHERTWNGGNGAGRTVSSGSYFVRLRAGERTESSKLLFLK